jgi:hypothetical protein
MASIAQKLATFGFGAASGSAITHFIKTNFQPDENNNQSEIYPIETVETKHHKMSAGISTHHKSTKSWNYESYSTSHPWDFDWDKRAHYTKLVSVDESGQPAKKKHKAVRHLLLVRHGQYNLKGETDQDRILTELGIKQAESTGRRLAELSLPLTSIVSSTMARAIQTSDLIRKFLPDNLKVLDQDVLLREGGPYPPEPRHRWAPEVRYHDDGARIEAAFRRYFHRAEPYQVNFLN